MSSTNQGNSGAAGGNQQAPNSFASAGSGGAANSVTNAISNGRLQTKTTKTVFLANSSGATFEITPAKLLTELSRQHTVFKEFTAGANFINLLPVRVDIWAEGSTFMNVRFNDANDKGDTIAVCNHQEYAIGTAGAERNHIGYSWPHDPHVRPWSLISNSNIMTVQVLDPAGGATSTGWFCQFTFTFWDRIYINLANGFFTDMTKDENDNEQKQIRGIKRVRRIKELTLPVNE